MVESRNNRYPGAMPFQDNDHDRKIFKGRDIEAKNLLNLVLSENLIVIYGKSGMGKTSLINAGLLHPLREKGYFPVTIRFTSNPPVDTIISSIERKAKNEGVLFQETDKESLWAYFYYNGFMNDDGFLTPVIILDQFEEFFFMYEEVVQSEFITQLSQLVRGIVPEKYKSGVNVSTSLKPEVKVIISLREDYLGYLEKMSISIPTILRIRFRVSTLTREQAREAIEEPAKIEDSKIDTAPFSYDSTAVDEIIDLLCSRNKKRGELYNSEVEAFPLQWICQYIENNVLKMQHAGEMNIVITRELIGGKEKMNQIFRDYYGTMLMNLTLGTRKHKAVVKLFEKGLISASWKRLSLEEDDIEDHYNVSREILQQLANLRILHMEPRAEGTYYELSHDTLVSAIQETKTTRKSKRQYVGVLRILLIGIIIILGYIVIAMKGLNKLGFLNIPLIMAILLSLFTMFLMAASDRNFIIGAIYQAQKQYKKAIPRFLRSIDNNSVVISYGFLGAAYYYIGKYQRAVSILVNAIELEPEDCLNYYYLGSAYRKLEKYNLAKEAFRKLYLCGLYSLKKKGIELKEDISTFDDQNLLSYAETVHKSCKKNKEVVLGIAEVYIMNRNYDKALELCNWYLVGEHKKAIPLCIKAEIESYMGKIDDAILSYRNAIHNNAKMLAPYLELGKLFIKKTMYPQALKLLKKANKINPNDSSIFKYLNVAQYKNGEYERYFSKLRKELGDNLKTLGLYSKQYANNDKINEQLNDKLINTIKTVLELKPNDIMSYTDLGDYYIRFEKFEQAKEQYNIVISLDENNLRAYEMLGYILLLEEKEEEAIEMYKKAIQLNSKDPDTYRALGWLYSRQDKTEEARALYNKTLEMDPQCGDAYYHLGYLKNKEGKREEAKQYYKKAIELKLQNKDVYVKIGYLFMEEDNYSEAKIYFEKALEVGIVTSELYLYLSNVSIYEKDYDKALSYLNKAIKLEPQKSACYLQMGRILSFQKKYPEAIEQYKKVLECLDSSVYDEALYAISLIYFDMEDFENATAAAERLIELKPIEAKGFELLGNIMYTQDRNKEAKNHLEKALELGSQNEDTIYMLGNIYYLLDKDHEKALDMYQKVIDINPKNVMAYRIIGYILYEQSNMADARRSFEKVLELGEENSDTYLYLSLIYREAGDIENEFEAMKKAYELEPENPDYIAGLAWLYYEFKKDYEEAISLNRKALSLDSKALWIHANLSLILIHNQQFNEGKSEYQLILRKLSEDWYTNDSNKNKKELVDEHILKDIYDAKKSASGNLLIELEAVIDLILKYEAEMLES